MQHLTENVLLIYLSNIAKTVYTCMYMNKMIPVETIPGMGGGKMKESSGGGEFKYASMIYLMQSKNFCKCHNVTPPQNNNKKLI
jgi:hypothetical protein